MKKRHFNETPGFDEKERPLEWNFKNTEILKKHGILCLKGILKNGNFEKHGILWMKGILKTRKFLKMWNFIT